MTIQFCFNKCCSITLHHICIFVMQCVTFIIAACHLHCFKLAMHCHTSWHALWQQVSWFCLCSVTGYVFALLRHSLPLNSRRRAIHALCSSRALWDASNGALWREPVWQTSYCLGTSEQYCCQPVLPPLQDAPLSGHEGPATIQWVARGGLPLFSESVDGLANVQWIMRLMRGGCHCSVSHEREEGLPPFSESWEGVTTI